MTVYLGSGVLILGDNHYSVSNNVRRISNGTRASNEVIRSIPENLPYDPKPFPMGIWRVTGVEWQKDKGFDPNTYGPVKIRTNAFQIVNVWELDGEGDYLSETETQTRDTGYLLHYSRSKTTLGCIRLDSEKDAIEIAGIIETRLERNETIRLEVI